LGARVRALRRREGLTQVKMAERLSISTSYLNLIEHDKRPLTAALLIKLASTFSVDLASFSADDDARLVGDLMAVFGDPMFDRHALANVDVRDLVHHAPAAAEAVLTLYRSYQGAREQAESLAARVLGDSPMDAAAARLPSEEVTDLIQRRNNHFAGLESAAEALWHEGGFDPADVASGLVRFLEDQLRVRIEVVQEAMARGAVRHYDPRTRVLRLSEVLAPRSRLFQLATQIGLVWQAELLDRLADDPHITTEASRKLARLVLAGYFAGAVLMPYEAILSAAQTERYDIELLGHRFRTSFEQVCHRLTTLQRPGDEGVPFHFLKIDSAGNLSKKFSASGIRFSRFGGSCPRWNVSQAFRSPGRLTTQVSRMPNGQPYFCVAKTVIRRHGGYKAPETVHAVGLGCKLEHASRLVYSDGVDLTSEDAIVPIGVTCRLCERSECDQRAFPSLRQPLRLDENVRGIGFYTEVEPR